jgi:hypothetical protein
MNKIIIDFLNIKECLICSSSLKKEEMSKLESPGYRYTSETM